MNKSKVLTMFRWEDDTFDIHNLDIDEVISDVNTAILAGHNLQIGTYRYDSIIMTVSACPYLKDKDLKKIIEEITGMKEFLIHEIPQEHLNKIINYMSLLMRDDLLRVMFQEGIPGNESMIRNAICNGRIDMAEVMVQEGVPLPEKITLFDIERRLNWDPARIRFAIKHGIKISLSDKEIVALNLLYPFFKKIG